MTARTDAHADDALAQRKFPDEKGVVFTGFETYCSAIIHYLTPFLH
jgi:hypothetical protein